MSNVRFLYSYKFDSATITAASEETGLPAANAVHEFVRKVWRATGDSGQWITFDLGTAAKITMIALFGHNLTSGATVTLQANTTDSWGAPAFSQTLTWHELAIVGFLDQTYRWWRLTIEDAANPDGYIEIGRICAGEFIEPDVNVDENLERKLHDPSTRQESDGRQGYAVERDVYRTYAVRFTGIAAAQQVQLETIFRAVKTIRYFVFCLDPGATAPGNDTIYCRMTTPLGDVLGEMGYGDVTLEFEEMVA